MHLLLFSKLTHVKLLAKFESGPSLTRSIWEYEYKNQNVFIYWTSNTSLLEYNIEDRVEEGLEYKNQNVFIYWTSNTSLLEYSIEDRVEEGLANAIE